MRPTLILRATEYKPMIQFIGQRKNIQHGPHAPAPHPCAPKEVAETFQSFLAKLQSTSSGKNASSKPKDQSLSDSAKGQPTPSGQYQSVSSSSPSSGASKSASGDGSGGSGSGSGKPVDFENFWEAPSYLWTPKALSDREVEAVMSGGATDIRTGP